MNRPERFAADAIENEQEFFAEMTECFFGTNDYYPFVRGELMTYDPAAYDLVRKLWGADALRPARAATRPTTKPASAPTPPASPP